MQLNFLPIEPAGELIGIDEALTLAITGHKALDLVAYENHDGQIVRFVRVGKKLKTVEFYRRYAEVAEEVLSSLKAAEIGAVVQSSDDRKYYRVPRGYWFGGNLHQPMLSLNPAYPGYRADLDGQPLMVDMATHQDWINAAKQSRRSDHVPNDAAFADLSHQLLEAGQNSSKATSTAETPQDERDVRDNSASSPNQTKPVVSLSEWAADAAKRGVTIRNARPDARDRMGAAAPVQEECREALRAAKKDIGKPVTAGRPLGRKSWGR